MSFLEANEPFALSALIVALGYLLKRTRVLRESDGEVLARVAMNVTLPSVILLNVPGVPLSGTNLLLPLAGLAGSAFMVLTALGFFYKKQNPADLGLSMTASSGYNIGLFAIPMVAGLYGSEGITRFALFDIGNAFAIFGLSWFLAWRYSSLKSSGNMGVRGIIRMFFGSLPFFTYIIAVVMNLSDIRVGGLPMRFLQIPAAMNRGVSLLTLGTLLRFRFPSATWSAIFPPLLLRYLFGLAVGVPVLLFLPLPPEYRITIAGAMVMPVGLAVIPFAARWGYSQSNAAAILNAGIPVSFILFWLVWLASRYLPALQI